MDLAPGRRWVALLFGLLAVGTISPLGLGAPVPTRNRPVISFAYYPSPSVISARVDLSALADRGSVRAVMLQVRNRKSGGIIAATSVPPSSKFVARLHEWKIPPLNGRYDLVVSLVGVRSRPQLLPFVRRHFPWEDNNLGKADIVVPPFTPIRVHGDTVNTLLRRCTMNGLGLWSRVQAKGESLLTGPMRIVVRAANKTFFGRGKLRFTQIGPTRVATLARWAAGPLKGRTRSVWDYDGMMKTVLTLAPTQAKLDSVVLVIPLANRRAPLMTACTDWGSGTNYAGRVPPGLGQVWNGAKMPRMQIAGSYVPYIWVGGPLRGIAVFGDNDRGWVDYRANTPCQELVRRSDGTLEVRLNLVAKPARLGTTHRILLGFQVTPIKPMPRNWRLWSMTEQQEPSPPRLLARGYNLCQLGCGFYYGTLTNVGDLYPRHRDVSIYRQLARTRRSGKIPSHFIDRWLAGYRRPVHVPGQGWGPDNYRSAVTWAFQWMAEKPSAVLAYVDPTCMRLDTPEGQTFVDEWDGHAHPPVHRRYPYGDYITHAVDPVESYRDYALWYYKKMLTTFADGIYFDETANLYSYRRTFHTDAYRLPDGVIQPTDPLWRARDLVRRTAVLDAELHKPNVNMVHMTNVAVAPILAFARADMDLEMKYGDAPFQERFTRSLLLTESLGRQFGNVPFILDGLVGQDPKKLAWAGRTEAGVALTFELRVAPWPAVTPCYWRNFKRLVKFGYGRPGVRVWNYWRRNYPMLVRGDKTSSIVVSKPGRALVVVSDWGNGGTIRLRPDLAVLHLPGRLTATNAETGKPVPVAADGIVEFPLKRFDFKMLLLR